MSLIQFLYQIIEIVRKHNIRIRDIRSQNFGNRLILSGERPINKNQIGVDGLPAGYMIKFDNISTSSNRLILLPYPIQLAIGVIHSEIYHI
jgi:hypothetical protein